MRRRALRHAPALLVPAAVVWLAGASGVALEPWAAAATAAVAAALGAAALVRGVRREAPLAWMAGLVAWTAADAVIRPVAVAPAAWVVSAGVVALLLLAAARSPRGRLWAGRAVVLLAGSVAVWLVVQRAAAAARPAGPLDNPNLGATLALLGVAVLPELRAPLVLRSAAGIVMGAGIVASGSRAGALGLLAVALVWGVTRRSRRAVTAAVVVGLVAAGGLGARLLRDHDPLRWERLRLWGVAARTTAAELPLGSGPGGYTDAALPHNFPRDGEFARFGRVPGVAESDPLQLAAVLGLPGLLLGAGLGVSLGRRAWASGAGGRGVVAAVVVTSAVNTQLSVPLVAWVATLAVAAVLPRPRGRRLRLAPAPAAALALLVAVPAGVALSWPRGGIAPDPGRLLDRASAAAQRPAASDAELADAEVQAWRGATARPRSAHGWDVLAAVRLRRAVLRGDAGLAAAAARSFSRAGAANPLDVWAVLGEGRARALLGDAAGALSALRAAVAMEPNCVPAWLETSRLEMEAGRLSQARAALDRAERALAAARRVTFLGGYDRALATADPVVLERLRHGLRGGP